MYLFFSFFGGGVDRLCSRLHTFLCMTVGDVQQCFSQMRDMPSLTSNTTLWCGMTAGNFAFQYSENRGRRAHHSFARYFTTYPLEPHAWKMLSWSSWHIFLSVYIGIFLWHRFPCEKIIIRKTKKVKGNWTNLMSDLKRSRASHCNPLRDCEHLLVDPTRIFMIFWTRGGRCFSPPCVRTCRASFFPPVFFFGSLGLLMGYDPFQLFLQQIHTRTQPPPWFDLSDITKNARWVSTSEVRRFLLQWGT